MVGEGQDGAAAQEEEEEVNVEEVAAAVPDILGEYRLFAAAGINVGEEEAFKVFAAIKQLAAKQGLTSVRFFGKIFGTKKDYLVAEAKPKEFPEEEETPNQKKEKGGEGANEFEYYVSNYAGGAWTKLPNVTPEQIQTARQVRRFFTGDLNSPVLGYPRFQWSEASLLRAQIARIAAATVISPKGYFSLSDGKKGG